MTDLTITYKNILLTICVEHYSPFVAGRHNGPPEDCQEDEQEEIEWYIIDTGSIKLLTCDYQKMPIEEKAHVHRRVENHKRFRYNDLTETECQEIHTLISKEINQHQVTRRQHRNPSVMPSISFSGSRS